MRRLLASPTQAADPKTTFAYDANMLGLPVARSSNCRVPIGRGWPKPPDAPPYAISGGRVYEAPMRGEIKCCEL